MLAVTTALALAFSPSVGIDFGALTGGDLKAAELDELYGEIALRLLEAGYPLREAKAASVRLIFERTDGRYEVAANANAKRFRTRAAPKPVELLELQHLALEATRVGSQAVALETDDTIDVVVEFDHAIDPGRVPGLMGRIVDVLVAEELVVVPNGRAADWRLCVDIEADEVRSFVVDGFEPCTGGGPGRPGMIGLEANIIDMWTNADLGGEIEPPTVDGPDDEPAPPMLEPSRATGWRLGVGAGGWVRRSHVDPALVLGLRGHGTSGFGAAVSATIVPGSAPELRVLDSYVLAGPAWATRLGDRGELGVALMAGVAIHHLRWVDGPSESPLVRFASGLDVAASWFVTDALALAFVLSPGASTHSQRHYLGRPDDDDKELVWQRGPVRLGAMLRLDYRWGGV